MNLQEALAAARAEEKRVPRGNSEVVQLWPVIVELRARGFSVKKCYSWLKDRGLVTIQESSFQTTFRATARRMAKAGDNGEASA